MPGFTAEFSACKTPRHYRSAGSPASRTCGLDVQALSPSACPLGFECGPPGEGTCCPPNRPVCCVNADNPVLQTYSCCPSNNPQCCQDPVGPGPCPEGALLCGNRCCPPGTSCRDHLRGVCCRTDESACHTELNTECCSGDLVCTPKGGCCAANRVCGDYCCPPGRCTIEGCCAEGKTISEGHCCPPGFVWAPDSESGISSCCPSDRVTVDGTCCQAGRTISEGHCCPPGAAWDSRSRACHSCPPGQAWAFFSNRCCPTDRITGGVCCPSGTPICGGVCCGPWPAWQCRAGTCHGPRPSPPTGARAELWSASA
jgi:hypothetical protein